MLTLITLTLQPLSNDNSDCSVERCTVDEVIRGASDHYGVSYSRLSCLAFRESSNRPDAYNGAGPFMGLFQFHVDGAGRSAMDHTPMAGYSPYDGYAAAEAAAYLISTGESWRWPVWNRGC